MGVSKSAGLWVPASYKLAGACVGGGSFAVAVVLVLLWLLLRGWAESHEDNDLLFQHHEASWAVEGYKSGVSAKEARVLGIEEGGFYGFSLWTVASGGWWRCDVMLPRSIKSVRVWWDVEPFLSLSPVQGKPDPW